MHAFSFRNPGWPAAALPALTRPLGPFTYVEVATNPPPLTYAPQRNLYNTGGIVFGFVPADRNPATIAITNGFSCPQRMVFEYWCHRFTTGGPFEVLLNGVVVGSGTLLNEAGTPRNAQGVDLASSLLFSIPLERGDYTPLIRKSVVNNTTNIAVQRFVLRLP